VDNDKKFENNAVYSKRVRAGKRRTYFFDVRTTKANDYYLTITESKKRFDDDNNYERHKVFIYKEDFVKFVNAMQETVDHIKNELLPDYDFDAHNHDDYDDEYRPREQNDNAVNNIEKSFDINQTPTTNVSDDVEKWD
jgi:hypothetical protein